VPAHYHANIVLQDGTTRSIRVLPNGTIFTPQQIEAMTKDNQGKKAERRQRFDQKKNRRGGYVNGRLAGTLGVSSMIVGGVIYAYGEYVETGSEGGNKLVNKYNLIKSLREGQDELPDESSFILTWRNGAVYIWIEANYDGIWFVAKNVTVDSDGRITKMDDDYLIRPGEAPYDFRPDDPISQRGIPVRPPDRSSLLVPSKNNGIAVDPKQFQH
jgi:hypothetical protein